jgi:hypothetical protein
MSSLFRQAIRRVTSRRMPEAIPNSGPRDPQSPSRFLRAPPPASIPSEISRDRHPSRARVNRMAGDPTRSLMDKNGQISRTIECGKYLLLNHEQSSLNRRATARRIRNLWLRRRTGRAGHWRVVGGTCLRLTFIRRHNLTISLDSFFEFLADVAGCLLRDAATFEKRDQKCQANCANCGHHRRQIKEMDIVLQS